MRPLRLLLSLAFFIIATTLLLILITRRPAQVDASTRREQNRFSALFSFHTPLFPPSAIISLTDDNSTFFLSRPAAFGPLLPSHGLSGQLWIGSGFGDDSFGRSGLQAGAEGELGCSDVPGWDATAGKVTTGTAGGSQKHQKAVTNHVATKQGPAAEHVEHSKRDKVIEEVSVKNSINDDGTDDHLHSPSPGSDTSNIGKAVSNQQHADIESLQETAEIAGKIVLLSRGGCGFLEKVKWAQRRGGIALIVGDDIVGGPLVTMYAKGDTSNVTIPSLFTSHTTAHLLSSLIPPHGFMNGRPISSSDEATVTEKQAGKGKGTPGKYSKPESATSTARPVSQKAKPTDNDQQSSKGWFSSLFGWMSGAGGASSVSRRPPSSGHLEWARLDEFHDDQPKGESKGKVENGKGTVSTLDEKPKDDFVIGVQDWRDPDVLKSSNNHEASIHNSQEDSKTPKKSDGKNEKSLKGGSITPGSGEYEKPGSSHNTPGSTKPPANNVHQDTGEEGSRGWFSHLFGGEDEDHTSQYEASKKKASNSNQPQPAHRSNANAKTHRVGQPGSDPEIHEGLWVTLTPTNLSSSPFFDTLLVLVVSPLITLTVVYALLLLRSRIQRRRWRAPKSVVERLPVRTYHSIPSEAASTVALAATAAETTPLLQHSSSSDVRSARRVLTRSRTNSHSSTRRLRSFTTSQVDSAAAQSSSSPSERPQILSQVPNRSSNTRDDEEKREAGLAEWRRRYGGRQKECVVCLEEYVEGVSRVMSLPCGHEFHAECM